MLRERSAATESAETAPIIEIATAAGVTGAPVPATRDTPTEPSDTSNTSEEVTTLRITEEPASAAGVSQVPTAPSSALTDDVASDQRNQPREVARGAGALVGAELSADKAVEISTKTCRARISLESPCASSRIQGIRQHKGRESESCSTTNTNKASPNTLKSYRNAILLNDSSKQTKALKSSVVGEDSSTSKTDIASRKKASAIDMRKKLQLRARKLESTKREPTKTSTLQKKTSNGQVSSIAPSDLDPKAKLSLSTRRTQEVRITHGLEGTPIGNKPRQA